jgi:RIO-like serine/threonine protein kinase
VTDKKASSILRQHSRKHWAEFVKFHDLELAIDRKVRTLLDRDALLEVSLTHEDLVNSNILVNEDSFVLVDYE